MTIPYMVKVRTEGKTGWDVQVLPEPIASKPEFIVVVALSIKRLLESYANKPNTIRARTRLQKELLSLLSDLHEQGVIVPKQAKKEKDEGTPYLDHLGHKKSISITRRS